MTAEITNMDVASRLAGVGHKVLPLCWPDGDGTCACGWGHTDKPGKPSEVGKAPRTPRGVKDASSKGADIFNWWKEVPKANVGLALQPSNLVMVDPDSQAAQEEARRLGLPPTLTRISKNPAYVYKLPPDVPHANITNWGESKELDVLAEGYMVAHGTHQTGCPVYLEDYQVEAAPAPEWVIELLRERSEQAQARNQASEERRKTATEGGEPPVRLSPASMEWWTGAKAKKGIDGSIDRSATLYTIGLVLASAGATQSTISQALAERDIVLGYEKYANRKDDREYWRIAEKVVADAADDSRGDGADTAKGEAFDPRMPYQATKDGLLYKSPNSRKFLTNFTARITAQVVEDDGVETRRILEIEASWKDRTRRFTVPATRFPQVDAWAIEHLGAGATVYAGSGIKDHARTAIQLLSREVGERRMFTHLGWREISGQWAYLHAGGAIGPHGPVPGVEVSLPESLARFRLPMPPEGESLVAAVGASLELLDMARDNITFPLYCGIWRASLGHGDLSLHLAGYTGAGKSELAALAQRHYGPEMDRLHLPAAWSSTDNALEGLAFAAKDALLVVDDFCPVGTKYDMQTMHRKADRLLRAQGNSSSRQRLRADATLRPPKPPRGLILSTGEDVPRGQSLRARVLVVDVAREGPDALDWDKLTACQQHAAAGLYAQAMAGFLQWLAPGYEEISRNLQAKIKTLREQAYQGGQHRHTPDIVAGLAVGFRYFLDFAQEAGAVSEAEAGHLWERCWASLGEAAAAQDGYQGVNDPVLRFLELLAAALSSGRAHLASSTGAAPETPQAWGWRGRQVGADQHYGPEWSPQGDAIGWIDGDDVYLQADAAYGVAQRLAHDGGDSLPVTLDTLKRRLKERGLLAATEKHISGGRAVERCEVRRTLQGKRRAVLHILSSSITPDSEPSEPKGGKTYPESPPVAHKIGSQTRAAPQNVSHESGPRTEAAVFEERGSGSLGSQNKGGDPPGVADSLEMGEL